MFREEKRRKFHEAVVKMLYPPPPSPPPPPSQREDEDRSARSYSDVGYDSGDLEGSGCSTSNENSGGEGKLSRAQRKRLRRKKLKEDASRRGNVIGPLLPPPMEGLGDDNGVVGDCPQGVRRNAAEKPDTFSATGNKEGEFRSQSNKKKLKHRRMAKRLAKDKLKPSSTQCCNQDPSSCGDDTSQESRPLREGHADED